MGIKLKTATVSSILSFTYCLENVIRCCPDYSIFGLSGIQRQVISKIEMLLLQYSLNSFGKSLQNNEQHRKSEQDVPISLGSAESEGI